MNQFVIYAALAIGILIAGAVSFFVGRSGGRRIEHDAQVAAKTTAEETARRIVDEGTRESEAQKRREEIERGERRLQERDSNLDRKIDILDQREKEVARRVADLSRRESTVVDREGELEKLRAE